MNSPYAIVRAYGGEPLKRVAVESQRGLIYIVNPALSEAVKSGGSLPVGIQPSDVFEFDPDVFAALRGAWDRGDAPDWESAVLTAFKG